MKRLLLAALGALLLPMSVLVAAPVAQAALPALAPAWAPWTAYATGAAVSYGGADYTAIQGHTSQPGWEPPNVPALWKASGGGGGADTQPPTTPGGLRATGTSTTSVSLAWETATDDVAVTGYELYRDGVLTATVAGTTHTDTGLAPGTAYVYTVRARDAAGNRSAAGGPLTATTQRGDGAPGQPGAPSVTAVTATSITLSWGAATGTVTGYRVYEGSAQAAQTTGTSATLTGLTPCTSHTYTVRAYNDAGDSIASAAVTGGTSGCTGGGNKLLGYFVQWGVYQRAYHVKNIDTSGSAAKLTHINYAFGNVQDGRCAIGDSYADYEKAYTAAESVDGVADTWDQPLRGNFNQLRKLKQKYPRLKVLFSFGGWTWSGGFGQAARNPAAFAESCYNLVEDPRWADVFDGVDIDWEYPNACGLTCDSSGPAAFRTLMQALRARFGSSSLVTAAITADGNPGGKLDAADYSGAAQYVDWYNVMTYDFFGTWAAQGPTAPHAPLTSYPGIPIPGFHADNAVQALKAKGVPAAKLLLGLGFYGRGWTGVTQSTPGGSATGPAPGTYEQGNEDYKVLKTRCPVTGVVAGTAYAHCGNQWWSYDTPATVSGKMSYAKQQALGGAFFWELSGDTGDGELITAMRSGLG